MLRQEPVDLHMSHCNTREIVEVCVQGNTRQQQATQ